MAVNEVKLTFTHVCQMSDNKSGKPFTRASEDEGFGSGGNRCTESCNAAIAWEWDLGAVRSQPEVFKTPEDVMFSLTEQRNGGSDVSRPRNGQEVLDWVNQHGAAKGVSMRSIAATWDSIVQMVNRGHVGMAGFGDYNKLRKVNGKSPYSWSDPDGDGHVLMVVGYNLAHQSVWVNDSLLGDKYQPAEYSFASFVNALFNSLAEVVAPGLPGAPAQVGGSPVGVPDGWKDDGKTLTNPKNKFVVSGGFREFVLANSWDAADVPLENEHAQWPLELSNASLGNGNEQIFVKTVLEWSPKDNNGKVFKMYAGQELLAERAALGKDGAQLQADKDQMDAMNKEINDLKAQLMTKTPPDVIASLNSILSQVQATAGALETLLKGVQ